MVEKRIFGYDLIKAVAMFLIVLYHLGSVDFGVVPENGWYIPNLTKCLYTFCAAGVPLFFMVNGALHASKQMSLRKCIEKSVRLILVAVFWTVLFTCVLYPRLRGSALPGIGEFENYYWFLYTLAALYIIIFCLNRWKWLRIITLGFLMVHPFVSNFIWDIVLLVNPTKKLPGWGHTGVFTMYSIIYYYLGAYLSKHDIDRYSALVISFLGLVIVIAEVMIMSRYDHQVYDGVNAAFPTLGALLLSAGLFSLLKQVKMERMERTRTVIACVGRNTIGIYIFHLFCVWAIKEYLFLYVTVNMVFAFLVVIGIVGVTTCLSNYILKSPLKILLKL